MAKLLVAHKAEISVNSMNEACSFGSVELVRFLMSHATDKVIKYNPYDENKLDEEKELSWRRNSYDGCSSIEVACKYNRTDIARVLLNDSKRVVDLAYAPKALSYACTTGNQAIKQRQSCC